MEGVRRSDRLIGLNCATGPAELRENLRYLINMARTPVVGGTTPGCGLGANGDEYPLLQDELAEAAVRFVYESVRTLVGRWLLPGTTHEHKSARSMRAIPGAARQRHVPSSQRWHRCTPQHR